MEVPKVMYIDALRGTYYGTLYKELIEATPLDDVKVEIADIYCGQYCENPLTADAVRKMVLDILDNIGKKESEDKE